MSPELCSPWWWIRLPKPVPERLTYKQQMIIHQWPCPRSLNVRLAQYHRAAPMSPALCPPWWWIRLPTGTREATIIKQMVAHQQPCSRFKSWVWLNTTKAAPVRPTPWPPLVENAVANRYQRGYMFSFTAGFHLANFSYLHCIPNHCSLGERVAQCTCPPKGGKHATPPFPLGRVMWISMLSRS